MQIGLIGLPQVGKKTLMRLLTRVNPEAVAPKKGVIPGVCPVRDPRLDRLAAMYNPKKVAPATIQVLLLPDMTKDSAGNQELLKALELVDLLAHVVRAFPDERVFHLEGSVDALRDIETVHVELILNDLLFVEKRLERMEKDKDKDKRSPTERARELALLAKLQGHLNTNLPLRTLALDSEEVKLLRSAPLLTRKPLLLILNVGEQEIQDRRLFEEIRKRTAAQQVFIVQVSAKVEEELSELEDAAERAAFLKDLGIAESAIDGLSRTSYEALGLLSFFTVGEDEVRAWTVRRGALAPEAAGAVHSDMERGFIRAEVIKYPDLIAAGSEQALASAGKAYLKGKDYVVEDGDILSFRFSV